MAQAGAPIEWIPGGPFLLYSTLIGAVGGGLGAGSMEWLDFQFFGPAPYSVSLLTFVALPMLFLLPCFIVAALALAAFVPMPAPRLGAFPGGILFDTGARRFFVPRARLKMVRNRLYVLPNRFGFTSAYALSVYQACRLTWILPGLAS